MFAVAAPTVVAMSSYTVMQFVDKLMASRISADPIYVGAQGNGGLAAWVPISIAMGFITVVNTYVSQHMGAGKPERGPAYAWNAMWIAVAWWLVLIPYAIFLPDLFRMLWAGETDGRLEERIALSAAYGQPMVLASVFTMGSRAIWQFFYGMHRASVVLVAGVSGNIVNFVANSILVFGENAPHTEYAITKWWFAHSAGFAKWLGIPGYGIQGSAYGTIMGVIVEAAIPMLIFLGPKFNAKYQTRRAWRLSLTHMRELFKIGWPGALMFGNEMVCWGLFMVYFVGHFGTEHSTAGWIAHQWMSLSFMPTVGLSIAATATVGKYMGMKRPDIAAKRAWLAIALAVAWMSTMGVLFVIFREQMVSLVIHESTPDDQKARVLQLGMGFMIAVAAFQFFDGVAMSVSGALRGAGDTVFVGLMTVALSWGVIVGGGLIAIYQFPELSSLGPWIAAAAYITLYAIIVMWRFLSGKWKSIKLVQGPEGTASAVPAGSPPEVAAESPG